MLAHEYHWLGTEVRIGFSVLPKIHRTLSYQTKMYMSQRKKKLYICIQILKFRRRKYIHDILFYQHVIEGYGFIRATLYFQSLGSGVNNIYVDWLFLLQALFFFGK